jgi:hypothetical protein
VVDENQVHLQVQGLHLELVVAEYLIQGTAADDYRIQGTYLAARGDYPIQGTCLSLVDASVQRRQAVHVQ